jgi:hypothetical protein
VAGASHSTGNSLASSASHNAATVSFGVGHDFRVLTGNDEKDTNAKWNIKVQNFITLVSVLVRIA